jgi:hypothetical protein
VAKVPIVSRVLKQSVLRYRNGKVTTDELWYKEILIESFYEYL